MTTRTFTGGRIRRVDYDPLTRQLDLHWDNRTVTAYRPVPEEVFRRLCAAMGWTIVANGEGIAIRFGSRPTIEQASA